MDKIHILEMIHRYDGQSVHIYTVDGKFYTGHLHVKTVSKPNIHRILEIGWRQIPVEIQSVTEIHPV